MLDFIRILWRITFSKFLTLWHLEWPKVCGVLAVLSGVGSIHTHAEKPERNVHLQKVVLPGAL